MNAKSVLMRLQGLRPGARAPICYATAWSTLDAIARRHILGKDT